MNFLAHLYLSGDNANIKIGNFIGDFVKGNDYLCYQNDIRKGIELHRAMDEFTDHHDIVRLSKIRLRPTYRHYSPVIVDVFYDHFLAKNWQSYHPLSLEVFAEESYTILSDHVSMLPMEAQHMLPYMISGNWLVNYRRPEGIHRALSGMAQRTTFESRMEEAINDLKNFYTEFEGEFTTFFPELINFAKQFISKQP